MLRHDILAECSPGLAPAVDPAFREDVLRCFAGGRRAIPARWLYDLAGSQLFEEITALPEYYLTRTETALLRTIESDLAAAIGPGRAVIEFGSGSSAKTPLVLRAIDAAAYVPIDISGAFLRASAEVLAVAIPGLPIYPVEADFTGPMTLPDAVADLPRLGFFPGSTIGNFVARRAVDLLRAMRQTLGDGARLLIGMDRIKPLDILLPAYDDAAGVTARFNFNLLHRINRELGGNIPVDRFRHRVIWNDPMGRIEMHLEAVEPVYFSVAGRPVRMAAGEGIHTENSHKFGARDGRLLLRAGGWTPIAEWQDANDWFAIVLCEAAPVEAAP